MLTRRVIPCLDCRDGRVVKGVRFQNLRDSGNPAELAARYELEGADEVVLLDISATLESRSNQWETVKLVRENLSIPLTVGGGMRSLVDIGRALDAGADKVALNTAAVNEPQLISRAAERFGAQSVVLAIDAEQIKSTVDADPRKANWRVRVRSGNEARQLSVVEWACRGAELGAGEILLTSFDRDGTALGYDLQLIASVSQAVSVPVIASGGAKDELDLLAGLTAGADAVLAASMFHEARVSIAQAKRFLAAAGLEVRL